jgi:branched-chain amino acid transport system substrate-binding protein
MKKILAFVTTLALAAGLMTGCGGSNTAATNDPIKLAVAAPFTGSDSIYGDYMKHGVELALAEINGAGGVLGRQLEVAYEDDKGSSTDAVSVAQKIASDSSVVGVIGHMFSGCTQAAGPVYQQNGIPTIAVCSTNPKVATIGDYVYRINVGDNYQGGALAELLIEKGLTKAAVIYENTDYGTGVATAFKDKYEELNGTVAMDESYAGDADDFSVLLTTLKQKDAQAIVMCGYQTAAAKIMMQAKSLNIDLPVYATDGVYNDDFINLAKEDAEGVYIVCYFHASDPTESVQNYIRKFQEKYPDVAVDPWSAYAYDAVRLMADAITRAGSTDRAAIKDAIASTTSFAGVTGTINFTGAREPVAKEIIIVQVKDGKFQVSGN